MDNQNQTQSWGEKLHELFSKTRKTETIIQQPPIQVNPEDLRQGETYEQWGTRICGIVTGRLVALSPYLQKVFNHLYNEQANNVELQQQARQNTQVQINQINDDISSLKNRITESNKKINDKEKSIEDLKNEQQEIKSGKEKVNKEQRVKLIIGLFILIPLTFYLFLFYSSTFYSAFFRDPSSMTNVMNSMFDSKALGNALSDGITELGFVLSAPIIFLGLGFFLHFFSVQKGNIKYLKMGSILLVTLLFDCILAYKIGKQLHDLDVITGICPIGEKYTIGMAFHDVNTWAVIFCGFIVYIIWGIVFDMSMTAYNKMDLNKTRLEEIKKEIEGLKQKIEEEKGIINNLTQNIEGKNKVVKDLMAKLGHEVYINYAEIRTEMTNFFAGWIKMMQILSLNKNLQNQAQTIYNNELAMLIKK